MHAVHPIKISIKEFQCIGTQSSPLVAYRSSSSSCARRAGSPACCCTSSHLTRIESAPACRALRASSMLWQGVRQGCARGASGRLPGCLHGPGCLQVADGGAQTPTKHDRVSLHLRAAAGLHAHLLAPTLLMLPHGISPSRPAARSAQPTAIEGLPGPRDTVAQGRRGSRWHRQHRCSLVRGTPAASMHSPSNHHRPASPLATCRPKPCSCTLSPTERFMAKKGTWKRSMACRAGGVRQASDQGGFQQAGFRHFNLGEGVPAGAACCKGGTPTACACLTGSVQTLAFVACTKAHAHCSPLACSSWRFTISTGQSRPMDAAKLLISGVPRLVTEAAGEACQVRCTGAGRHQGASRAPAARSAKQQV